MNKGKNLGNITRMKINLVEPMVMSIDSMDFKTLNLLCGSNGSGKTMISKLTFFAMLSTFIDINHPPNFVFEGSDATQFVFDNTFTSPEELTGSFVVEFDNGTCLFEIHKGKCIMRPFYDKDVVNGNYMRYMSTSTRLFTSIEAILFTDKLLNGSDEVLKVYKLYELLQCCEIREFARNVSNLEESIISIMKSDFGIDIVSIHYNSEDCKFSYLDSKTETHLVSNLSNGQQSMLNMLISKQL